MGKLEEAYDAIVSVASPDASEGLLKERVILLLWYLRNVLGIDDIDAYDYICDGDDDLGLDGLMEDSDNDSTIVFMQSKFPETAKNVGPNDLKKFVGSIKPFETAGGLKKMLSGNVEPALEKLIDRFQLVDRLENGKLKHRLLYVTAGLLDGKGKAYVDTVNKLHGAGYLTTVDVLDLKKFVDAFKGPTLVSGTLDLDCPSTKRFEVDLADGKAVLAAIKVTDVVTWPGIDDRTLFELNIRKQLRKNDVRKALDEAIEKTSEHGNFIACHNGLTVICRAIDTSDAKRLKITDLSVVNGAQSTIAFKDNEDRVSKELLVSVKFVQTAPEKSLARAVAIRSNTQNPINQRNLRGRDNIQLMIEQEFKSSYSHYHYEMRPDATQKFPNKKIIQNDVAAQLVTAVIHQEPWLAVKKLSLFESATYPHVFGGIHAPHIIVCDLINEIVGELKAKFPPDYAKSWQLTRLIAVYLIGQLLHSPEHIEVLNNPAKVLKDGPALRARLTKLAGIAVGTLQYRFQVRQGGPDDFKVEFKRESSLRDLAKEMKASMAMTQTINATAKEIEDSAPATPTGKKKK